MNKKGTRINNIKLKSNLEKYHNQSINELRKYSNGAIGAFFKNGTFRFVGKKNIKKKRLFYGGKNGKQTGGYIWDENQIFTLNDVNHDEKMGLLRRSLNTLQRGLSDSDQRDLLNMHIAELNYAMDRRNVLGENMNYWDCDWDNNTSPENTTNCWNDLGFYWSAIELLVKKSRTIRLSVAANLESLVQTWLQKRDIVRRMPGGNFASGVNFKTEYALKLLKLSEQYHNVLWHSKESDDA